MGRTLARVQQVKTRTRRARTERSAPKSPVGGRIKAARTKAGLTQQKVAGERYTKAYISALENGLVRPSVAALEYIAERLGTTPAALMSDARPTWSRLESDLQLAAGNWQAAADGYRALLEETGKTLDKAQTAELLRGEAEALIRLDRGAEAASVASQAVEIYEGLGREADAALASYWLAAAMYEQDNLDEAKAILHAVLGKVRAGMRVEPDFKLRLLMSLSSTESRDANHQAALSYLEEIRSLADTLDDRRRAVYLSDLAYSYCETGDYEAAIRVGYASLALSSSVETMINMASLENQLALAHLHTGNLGKADEMARSSERRFAALANDRRRAHVLDTRAQIELAQQAPAAALRLAAESLALAETTGNVPAQIDALLTLGRAEAAGTDAAARQRAADAFSRAADLARDSKRGAMLRRVLTQWADFLAAQGDHEAAFRLTREALASEG